MLLKFIWYVKTIRRIELEESLLYSFSVMDERAIANGPTTDFYSNIFHSAFREKLAEANEKRDAHIFKELRLLDEEHNWAHQWLRSKGVVEHDLLIILLLGASSTDKVMDGKEILGLVRALSLNGVGVKFIFISEMLHPENQWVEAEIEARRCANAIVAEGLGLRKVMSLMAHRQVAAIIGPCTGLMHLADGIYSYLMNHRIVNLDNCPLLLTYSGKQAPEKRYHPNNWWGDANIVTCCICVKSITNEKQLLPLKNCPKDLKTFNSISLIAREIGGELLRDLVDALQAAKSILLAINRTWSQKQGDFFVDSPINLLAAAIWFLRRYQDGLYCTLPHAIELLQLNYESLFTVLNSEPEISALVSPFIDAYRDDVMETLVGQLASVKIPLGRLSSPHLYYILTGNDFTQNINDPDQPKIVCLGNDPIRSEALAPVISLFCDQLNKVINQKGKTKCATVYDEFATIRAASVQTVIQVGRSNDIMPIIVIQDFSQLKQNYPREEAEALFNMAGNILCGQVNGETAKLVADRFPRIRQPRTSLSSNSQDVSVSESIQLDPAIPASTISALSSGEFVGIVADDPAMPIILKAVHARIIKDPDAADRARRSLTPLPQVHRVEEVTIRENYQKVIKDIREIYDDVRMTLEKPGKSHLIVQKPHE